MGWKLLLMAHASEITDTESIDVYADDAPILRALRWFDLGSSCRSPHRRLAEPSRLASLVRPVRVDRGRYGGHGAVLRDGSLPLPLLPPLMMFAARPPARCRLGWGAVIAPEWLPDPSRGGTRGRRAPAADARPGRNLCECRNELIRTGSRSSDPGAGESGPGAPRLRPRTTSTSASPSVRPRQSQAMTSFGRPFAVSGLRRAHAALGLGLLAAKGVRGAPAPARCVRYQPMSADFRGHLGTRCTAGQLGDAVSSCRRRCA